MGSVTHLKKAKHGGTCLITIDPYMFKLSSNFMGRAPMGSSSWCMCVEGWGGDTSALLSAVHLHLTVNCPNYRVRQGLLGSYHVNLSTTLYSGINPLIHAKSALKSGQSGTGSVSDATHRVGSILFINRQTVWQHVLI